jgi:hypothetical protein
VWGQTHGVLFDFTATVAVAEWIDAVAAASGAVVRSSEVPGVIGHRERSAFPE